MHKLTFSIGLILLMAFSVFSPLQILKIENANAQVTVPKTYIQTVNDWDINSTYAWDNFTTGLDPDALALVNNGSDSCFTAYTKRVGADAWGDSICRQGYEPHASGYCRDWNNKIIKPMIHYPYIPADVGNDQIILQATAKHSAPVYYGDWPINPTISLWPTIGGTIMLYFNVYVHDNVHNVDKWLFDYHNPDSWAGPNLFILEIFMTRWTVELPGLHFTSRPPGFFAFEQFFTRTTHDNDLHLITCPFDMPTSNQWYYMIYDVGTKIPDCVYQIEKWGTVLIGHMQIKTYTVLGFQLMTIAMGVETIGGSWTFQFGDISLTDMRWGTGSAYQNSAKWELKTMSDGVQSVPRLSGVLGYPNPLRPYMTYTDDDLEADVDDNGFITGNDVARVAWRFGHSVNTSRWDYTCDMNKNDKIDGYDVAFVSSHFGEWGTYETGLGAVKVWMQEEGPYNPDPPPGYTGWWLIPRSIPYTCHLYMELWDVLDWPSHISSSINYMGSAVFYNGTTLNQTGICLYAYDYPIHD